MIADSSGYNVAKIRELLLAAFTPEELRRFCADHTLFEPIIQRLGPKYNLLEMVDEVIDYCRTRLLWQELLAEVAVVNSRQYARFEPDLGTMLLPEGPSFYPLPWKPWETMTGTSTVTQREREIVGSLLTFLEDRRLLTDNTGYQSHFPDHLRLSAEAIRRRTNDALQQVGRESEVAPILRRLQKGARNFQEATEGAMDGHRAGGGLTPFLPMPLDEYLQSLKDYRQEMADAMLEAAQVCGFELGDFLTTFWEGQRSLESLIDAVRNQRSAGEA